MSNLLSTPSEPPCSGEESIGNDQPTLTQCEMAKEAEEVEKKMTRSEAFRTFRPAVYFGILFSAACVMEGFDIVQTTGLFALQRFRDEYGVPVVVIKPDGSAVEEYEISAPWQLGITSGMMVGEIVGILLNGYLTERLGYKKTFLTSLIAITSFILVLFCANSLPLFLIGMTICGIPWGIFQVLATQYASDICPVASIRAYTTSFTNLCWIIGQITGSGIQRAFMNNETVWAYKLPIALQWVWPVPIFIGALFAPESPFWLIRRGDKDGAIKAVTKLTCSAKAPDGYSVENHVALLSETNDREVKDVINGAGANGYLDCFKGINLRRTEICCVSWAVQNLCGAALMQFSTYFFLQAGLPADQAFTLTVIAYVIGLAGAPLNWALTTLYGRRTIVLAGAFTLTTVLLTIGSISVAPLSATASGWAIGALLLLFALVFCSTLGPTIYSVVSEIPSTRLKAKTINLARMAYLLVGVFNSSITPYMLNPGAWGWGAKTGFFWAAVCALCTVYVYFRVPETMGRTYAAIDELFKRKIEARKFAGTKIDLFGEGRKGESLLGGFVSIPL